MLSHFSFIKTRQNSLYESIKRELKTRPVNESRYDERLKLKLIYTTRIHWVTRGTGTPKDKDELNKREVYECDGWVCDRDTIGVPSIFKVIRNVTVLTRMLSTLPFNCVENTVWWKWKSPLVECGKWTIETSKKRSVSRWVSVNEEGHDGEGEGVRRSISPVCIREWGGWGRGGCGIRTVCLLWFRNVISV